MQDWLRTVEERAEADHQSDSLLSPATFLAGGAALAIFGAVNAALVRPSR